MSDFEEIYLGDGLYAACDRWGTITLRAPRGTDGDHYVVLESQVLAAFEAWVARLRDERKAAP